MIRGQMDHIVFQELADKVNVIIIFGRQVMGIEN